MSFQVYTLAHPETGEVRYVGKTTKNLNRRLRMHVNTANLFVKNKKNRHLTNWIKSLPADPVIEELEELTTQELLTEAEIYWIENFKWLGVRLVNSTAGGEGCIGYKPTEETLKKLSLSHMGHTHNRGKVRTKEQNIQNSRRSGGRPFIDQFGNRYETINSASRQLKINRSGIQRVLKGKDHYTASTKQDVCCPVRYVFKYIESQS